MKDLYTYLCEDVFVGSSDRSIYKRLAQHKWNHMERANKSGIERAKKSYPGIPDNDSQLIKWFKDANGELVPDKYEIIHRNDWNMLEQVGEIESVLMSPHKWTFFDWICKNEHKKNKILVVLECGNSKPYCQDSSKKWYLSKFRSFCDFSCCSYGIIPEEYSMIYPVRHDEWSHMDESESIKFKYHIVSCNRGYNYIKAMGYEHVIVFFQNPDPEKCMRWMVNMPDMKDKLHFVVTDQLMTKLKRKYPQFGRGGLLITRLVNLPDTQEKFMSVLKKCLSGDDLDRFKEIEKLINDNDRSGIKRWVEETNEKFDIKPYETDKPTWENKLKRSEIPHHTYTSDVETTLVNKFKSWLKKWADEQDEKDITKDTNLFEERLMFTPLDLILDMYKVDEKNPKLLEVDKLYWNMMKALEECMDELKFHRLEDDKYGRYKYLFVFDRVLKEKKKDELKKYSDKIGYSQFDQNPLER